jgi:hypothetical protein
MGGGYYDGDVAERSRESSREHFVHTIEMLERPPEERECHQSLDPNGKDRECCDHPDHPNTTPIGVLMDLTRSRGDDAKVIFGKLPMMIGQIKLNNYVPDPEICFVGIGDATCDQAPVQVGQFESDNRLDAVLGNMWIELGGGGTGQESYQLGAYYMARHTKLDCLKREKKGVCFIFADEGFYSVVDKGEVKRIIGDKLTADIPSAQIFAELRKKYDTYVIFPRSSWKDRKDDIDEEIAQRVRGAGGMIEGVDVRFSLIWHNRNDLDLHVQGPDGHHIYYGSKVSRTGGNLDVDMNVRGETTKPVENTRWAKGKAPKGKYKVWVENYAFHEDSEVSTDFKVEIEVNGEVTHFTGKTNRGATSENSRVDVGTFTFDPAKQSSDKNAEEKYAGYDEAKIKAQWATVVPSENILMIDDAKAAVDIMLGVLAITKGGRTLDTYLKEMKARGQSEKRIGQMEKSLADLAELTATTTVDASAIPAARKRPLQRKGSSTRI